MRIGMSATWIIGLLVASGVGWAAAAPAASADDISGWQVYRSEQYFFELRFPPDFVAIAPSNQLRPQPIFRVWFKQASMANSPIADREPPQLAIDVYDNPMRQTLDVWLAENGFIRNFARAARQSANVGGIDGLHLTDQALSAPNSYYFAARGLSVYRFTPLGALSDRMLATVRFIR